MFHVLFNDVVHGEVDEMVGATSMTNMNASPGDEVMLSDIEGQVETFLIEIEA